uniref:Testis-expressed sequence 9 protein-like n=1 Tax=Saccoglossus kowalevskii TaxID=10224 RepID=A0ABM0MHD7_SACKO|nr:PREDICTED: testis-expressed sequence 9 protein-like [Saccoglossus kowalevskii]
MAEKSSRPSSQARRSATQSRQSGTSQDLLSREEEYKRLNAELEAKTAGLIQQAEDVMRGQESMLSKASRGILDSDEYEYDINNSPIFDTEPHSITDNLEQERLLSQQSGTRASSSRSKPPSRPQSRTKKSKPKTKSNNIGDNTFPFATSLDQNLVETMKNYVGKLIFTEATIRFLKAKVRVMQEELDRISHEYSKRDEENNQLLGKIKDAEDEKRRLLKTNQSQQTQIEKYKTISQDAKSKGDGLENQVIALRKELDALKRGQKQATATQGATEVRLNRALEEIEKLKSQLHKSRQGSKDTMDQDKRRIEQLQLENKRLEKQKAELMAGFKKQLKLIDILKRQKMHIEAAKMLSFTEEEFVKALEWGN